MTPFFHCKKAEIHGPDAGGSVLAEVSIAPTGGLLLTVPRSFRSQYRSGDPIETAFYDPLMGIVTCRTRLTVPLISDDHQSCSYRCEVLEQLSQDQRREDMKIPLSADITVTLEETGDGRPLPVPPPECSAVLWNISAGGVYLLSKAEFQVGDRLFFYFHKLGGSLPLTAQILRAEPRTDRLNRPIHGYGCSFVDLAASYEAKLRSYVFKEARRLYNDG